MAKKKVFFSYYYEKDGNKVDDIRGMGLVRDIKPASKKEWDNICSKGDEAVKNWIDTNMKDAETVVVFIGEDTIKRKWIIYEIEKAWNEGKGLLGIYIHNMDGSNYGKTNKGENPFEHFKMNRDGKTLRSVIKCYDPDPKDAYNCIFEHIEDWISDAKSIRDFY
jgi:hypothetical protein